MARIPSLSDSTRKLLEGAGLGHGADYRPWLDARTTPTRGVASQTLGIKTGRVHHGLSTNEKNFFYIVEFDQSVIDIREQFPLFPQNLAMRLADGLGIKYPTIPKTKIPCVITTDFLVTYSRKGKKEFAAFSVKPKSGLKTKRDFEKQELERVWWESLGVPWKIFINDEQDAVVADNIRWLSHPLRDGSYRHHNVLASVLEYLSPGVYQLDYLFSSLAQQLKLPESEIGEIFRILAWNHLVDIELGTSIHESGIINILSIAHDYMKEGLYGTFD